MKRGSSSHVIKTSLSQLGVALLTRDSEVLYASASVSKAVLRAFPVELSPLASMLFVLRRLSAMGPRWSLERRTHNFSMFAYRSVAPSEDLQLEREAMAASTTPSEESGAVLRPGTLGCLARYEGCLQREGLISRATSDLLV
jgi:hypothetical protein